jgi:hypothetical protein
MGRHTVTRKKLSSYFVRFFIALQGGRAFAEVAQYGEAGAEALVVRCVFVSASTVFTVLAPSGRFFGKEGS